MKEILGTHTVAGTSGYPRLQIQLNYFKPLYMAKMVALSTLVVAEFCFLLLILTFRGASEGKTSQASSNTPTQKPAGDFSSKGLEIDFHLEDSSYKDELFLVVRGVIAENEKYALRLKEPDGRVHKIADIDRNSTVLDHGCKFLRFLRDRGKYIATIEDYGTGKIIAKKEITHNP